MKQLTAYPLTWPLGFKRTILPQHSRFKGTFYSAKEKLLAELKKLGASNVILSTNIPLKKDGLSYATYRLEDNGVAIYFTYKHKQVTFACDKWKDIKDNVRSIAETIYAIRAIERWGVSDMLDRTFVGFEALPEKNENWWEILDIDKMANTIQKKEAYRILVLKYHPDRGGNSDHFARIVKAYEQSLK